MARRVADLLVARTSAPDGVEAFFDGHPEVETALVELYRETGEAAVPEGWPSCSCRTARSRHRSTRDASSPRTSRTICPVREATEATGHAVRQLYLARRGHRRVPSRPVTQSLLAAMTGCGTAPSPPRLYVTGGHGSRHRDEAYGDPYELPPDRAYAETCAAIAGLQWGWRMLLATGEARYAEEMERALLNAIAASTAHTGTAFFYSNPLQLRTGHDGSSEDAPSERLSWYACACCPPNLARLLASVHGYAATTSAAGLQLHLLTAGAFEGPGLTAVVRTGYPYDGDVRITVRGAGELAVRVPPWATGATANGAAVTPGEYFRTRVADGDEVRLTLPMTPRLVRADERVDAVRGCVAVLRGPLVCCVEQADLPGDVLVEQLRLDPAAPIVAEPGDEMSPVRLRLSGVARELAPELYGPYDPAPPVDEPVTFTAIPYHAWANRGPGAMRVWLPLK